MRYNWKDICGTNYSQNIDLQGGPCRKYWYLTLVLLMKSDEMIYYWKYNFLNKLDVPTEEKFNIIYKPMIWWWNLFSIVTEVSLKLLYLCFVYFLFIASFISYIFTHIHKKEIRVSFLGLRFTAPFNDPTHFHFESGFVNREGTLLFLSFLPLLRAPKV